MTLDSTPRCILKGLKKGPKSTRAYAFVAALLTTVKRWEQPTRPVTDEWINRLGCVCVCVCVCVCTCIMEYYSAIKGMKH